MKLEKYVLSLSGGKDSTAMLLRLLEESRPVDFIIYCDRGQNFRAKGGIGAVQTGGELNAGY